MNTDMLKKIMTVQGVSGGESGKVINVRLTAIEGEGMLGERVE